MCLSVQLQLYRGYKVVIQFFQMLCIHALTLHLIMTRIGSHGRQRRIHRAAARGTRRRRGGDCDLARAELQVEVPPPEADQGKHQSIYAH